MPDPSTQVQTIRRAGLFDVGDYVRLNGLSLLQIDDPLDHYCSVGEALGYRPNALFDPAWYRAASGVQGPGLLIHYATVGERAGLSPSVLFDAPWYRDRYGVEAPLAHYLANRRAGAVSPNAWFDAAYFAAGNPDLPAGTADLYTDFVDRGVFEGRRPSAGFDPEHIWRRYLNGDRSRNPFILFLRYGRELGWTGLPDPGAASVAGEIARATSPDAGFEEAPLLTGGPRRAKALAFYLPQFHAIPENDRWWGKGFTEWRNVARGTPRFAGHYQPRVPRDLGHYELSGTNVLRRQVELASQAGLHGFCFYYYNFNGQRLLEKPVEAYLADPAITFPFCLMWANENWTRRWDGRDRDVLIAQDYRAEDDGALVADLARHMRDPRYIGVGGRPLLFVYRADVIPDTARTLRRWRGLFEREHGLQPLIVMAQTFGNTDPRPAGFDAAVEFPPHKFIGAIPALGRTVQAFEPGFSGDVRGYDDMVAASLGEPAPDYPLIKTAVPGWDNEARRPGQGLTLHGSTPAKFQAWMEALLARSETAPVFGERLVCVNAWNEWAEAAYLEPDLRHGYAYLNALSRSLCALKPGARRKVLLVGHDGHRAGAQMLLYNIGLVLRFRFGLQVAFVLMDGGLLAPRYADVAPTYVVEGRSDFWPALVRHLHGLREQGFGAAITNSAMSGHVVPVLADLGFAVCSLIHEMPTFLARSKGGAERLDLILSRSDHVVFPTAPVRDAIAERFGAPAKGASIAPQGLYREIPDADPAADRRIREALGIGPQVQIVLNAGFADLRKGVDLFVTIARFVATISSRIVFVWLGDVEPAVETWLLDGVRADPSSNLRFLPFTDDIGPYLNAADLFLLTSREDPFPSVVLEALGAGLPVAAFRGGGGYAELLGDPKLGMLLPMEDIAEAATTLVRHLAGRGERTEALDAYRRAHVAQHYDFARYCFAVLGRIMPAPTVSVIVPVMTDVAAIEARLASVFGQGHPTFDVIVLDDGASEAGVAAIERVASQHRRDLILIEDPANAGPAPGRWLRGVERASGDLVWIAEADGLAEPGFLDGLVPFFEGRDTAFAFSAFRPIGERRADASGAAPARNASMLLGGRELLDGHPGPHRRGPAMTAVLWRRDVLVKVLSEQDPQRSGGADGRDPYERAAELGRVGFNADALGVHLGDGAPARDVAQAGWPIPAQGVSRRRAVAARGEGGPEATVSADQGVEAAAAGPSAPGSPVRPPVDLAGAPPRSRA